MTLFLFLTLATSPCSWSAETSTTFDTMQVLEDRDRLEKVTGSQKLGAGVLSDQKTTDVLKALKQLPGVQVQEEDGLGLRPNIGLRGTHPHRSRKVVIMEDGVLAGPAPYSAPAAYYTPSMLHTRNLEIFKGLAAVPFGPNSIGGAINYLSTDFPQRNEARAQYSAGSFGSQVMLAEMGAAKTGYAALLSGSRAQNTGFKTLPDGSDTGFKKNDVVLKAKTKAFGPEGEVSLKGGYSDELSHETYLGLTADDFRRNAYSRYAASSRDNMDWNHTTGRIDYQLAVGMGTLKTSLYRHDFHRNWERFDGFRSTPNNPDNNNDPFSVSEIIRNPRGAVLPYYRILTGEEDSSSLGSAGDLNIVQNDRRFFSQGWQTELWQGFDTGEVTHGATLGVRLHQDQIKSDQRYDYYSMTSGALVRRSPVSLYSTRKTNTAFAKTVTAQDELKWKNWRAHLAGRFEDVDYDLEDRLTNVSDKRNSRGFAPGGGLGYQLTRDWGIFGSLSRGLTLVGTSPSDGGGPERSVNYELSSLYLNEDHELQAEIAGFFNDYQNIKGTASDTGAAGASARMDEEYSGGKAKVYGVEGRLSKNFRVDKFSFPIRANATFIDARFSETVESNNPDWGIGTIRPGDPLPYIPQAQFALGLGAQYKNFHQELLVQYTGRVFDQAIAGRAQVPAYGLLDWTSRYHYSKRGHVFARVDNILNNRYAVSWQPYGLRPGKPQGFMVGVEQVF